MSNHTKTINNNNININNTTKVKGTPFRFTGKKMFITIKGHQPQEYLDMIDNIYPIKKYIFCHEKADETDPYLHSHIAIEFTKKIDFTNQRKLDYKGIHPNIQPIRQWEKSIKYCMKEGTYFTNIEERILNKINKDYEGRDIANKLERIWSAPNLRDALTKNANDIKDIIPIIQTYNFCNQEDTIDPDCIADWKNFEMYPWQKTLFSYLTVTRPDNRSVMWIYDNAGESGKTAFATYYTDINHNESILINSVNEAKNINDIIRNWINKPCKRFPKVIFFNIPRTDKKSDAIYTAIECIKDGKITCEKYKGETIRLGRCHIVVMSNEPPEMSKLTGGRWHNYTLWNKNLYAGIQYNIEESVSEPCESIDNCFFEFDAFIKKTEPIFIEDEITLKKPIKYDEFNFFG